MYKKLLSSGKIGTLELKNRMIVTAMVTSFSSDDHLITDRLVEYMKEKASGGWGMIITEGQSISAVGNGFSNHLGIYEDAMLENEKKLTAAVHKAGSKICLQLMHSGRQAIYVNKNRMAVAPSPIKDPTLKYTPKEMTVEDMEQTLKDYASAAKRAKEAGYDAVEIHGAHGYLLHEFFSPASNKRTDEYGGSLEGRVKFPLQVVKAVREAVGKDFPVIYRISTLEQMPNGEGIGIADSMAFAVMLEEAGIDAIHSTVGNYETEKFQIAPAAVERALNAPAAGELKKIVNIPVICVGKFREPQIAEVMLAAEKCDFIGIGRQSLADPLYPKKIMEGKTDEIRYCIGCQIGCLMRLKNDEPIACTVNPRMGNEYKYPEKVSDQMKKVVVVGGGVGGMQAAITAAEQGHDVTIYEKTAKLGGQWNIAAVPPYKQDMASFAVWQQKMLKKNNVKVVLNTTLTAEDIIAMNPDKVIIATGATPIVPPIKGYDHENVHTSFEILSGEKVVKGKTAVIGGGDVGCETANFLASTGISVAIFEMLPKLNSRMESGVTYYLREYMQTHNVEVYTGAKVMELKENSIVFEQNGEQKEYDNITDIVFAIGQKSQNSLADELRGKVDIVVVGDAGKIGHAIDAIQAGYDAAYNI